MQRSANCDPWANCAREVLSAQNVPFKNSSNENSRVKSLHL